MKYLFVLIFLPLFSLAQSNDQLDGLWVKVKAEMKDGSRIVNHFGCEMDFLKYNFTNDGFVDRSSDVLFDGYKLHYKISGDSLSIAGNLFDIIGLTNDTLKLSVFIPGAEDNQLPVYYFAKVMDHHSVAARPVFDPVLKDSVYQATNQLFPQCKGAMTSLMYAIAANYDKGTLKASFIIDKKGRVRSYTILSMDSISKGFARTIGNAIETVTWQPAKMNGLPVNSVVQITLKTGRMPYGGRNTMINTMRIVYDFLPKPPFPEIDKDEFDAAQQYFKDAITLSNSGNYVKAIELLNKSIEIDNINLSAYYFRAFINSGRGNMKEACKDWTFLAGLGQVDAAKKLAKFCKN